MEHSFDRDRGAGSRGERRTELPQSPRAAATAEPRRAERLEYELSNEELEDVAGGLPRAYVDRPLGEPPFMDGTRAY